MRYKWMFLVCLFLHALGLQAQKVLPGSYDEVYHLFNCSDRNIETQPFSNGLAAFMIKGAKPLDWKTNRVGFIDTAGGVAIEAAYTNCSNFRGDLALVQDTAGNTAVINRKGHIVIPFGKEFITACTNGLFIKTRFSQPRSISIVDAKNRTIVPFGRYAFYASRWASIYPLVMEDGYYGGEPTIFRWRPLTFFVLPFDKYLPVKTGNAKTDKWAIINNKGKEVVPPKFDGIGLFANGLAPFRIDKNCGIADTTGNEIIHPEYDNIELSGNGFAIAIINKQSGLLTLSGKVLAPFVYRRITNIGDDRFLVDSATGTYTGKTGVIGKTGAFIIPLANHGIQPFGTGYLIDENNDSTAVFDSAGIRKSAYAARGSVHYPVWEMEDDLGYIVYNESKRDFIHYDEVRDLTYKKDDKWGLLDSAGGEVTAAVYDQIGYLVGHSLIEVQQSNHWELINSKGQQVTPGLYDEILPQQGGSFLIKKERKLGLINDKGKIIVPVAYDRIDITPYGGAVTIIVTLNGKLGYFTHNGTQICPVKYQLAAPFREGLAEVMLGYKWGMLDSLGKLRVPCIYDGFYPGRGSLVIVSQNKLYGVINHRGKVIYPPVCTSVTAGWLRDRPVFILVRDGKTGMVDTSGKMILKYKFSEAIGLIPAYGKPAKVLLVKDKGLYGIADFNEKILLPEQYTRIFPAEGTSKQLYYIMQGENQGIADERGQILIPVNNWAFYWINDKFISLRQGDYSGVIDWQQNVIVPFSYDQVDLVQSGFIVRYNEKYGVLDLHGTEIIPRIYDNIAGYFQNVYIVMKEHKQGVIDAAGKIILPVIYDQVVTSGKDKILVRKDKLMGLIDNTGKVIYPCQYTLIRCVDGKVVEIY